MRPVERGDIPKNRLTNSDVKFPVYDQAKPYLTTNIGEYCSYCERRVNNLLAVEHIQPKNIRSDLELAWDNFLLACVNCNSIKGHAKVSLGDYYWPDRDNTVRAFTYFATGIVGVNVTLTPEQKEKAKRTIELTGLDRTPAHPNYSYRDNRWQERKEIWEIAVDSLADLENNNTEELRKRIVALAIRSGCFSIWMSVFQDDADMLNRFIAAFPGTCKDCFDRQGKPLPRPGGAL
jgi:uncharacterized protein (TIGR02646 family)